MSARVSLWWPMGYVFYEIKGIAMFQKLHVRISLVMLLLAVSANSNAAFDQWRINEVFSNASGTVQFIELRTTVSGQQFFKGTMISSSMGSSTNSYQFEITLNGGSDYSPPKTFLVGTAGFAALGIVTPDYVVPNGFLFTSNVTINFAGVDIVTFPSIPTDGFHSIDRNGVLANNSPTNFSGATGTIYPPLPGAPTIGAATAGNNQATISFTQGYLGSSPTSGYTATCVWPSGTTTTGTGPASPIMVIGLSNGVPYTCSVTAMNANGTGAASGSVNVTPAAPVTVPGSPTINFATAGDTLATLNFNPPASNGGAAISNYVVTCGTATANGISSPVTVTGLTNGTTYSCTVAAVNSVGTGPQSTPRNVMPGTPPGTPVITSVVAGNAQATIAFTIPANGGSPIVGYGVSCNSGQVTASGSSSPIVLAGLANGTTYSCTVTATNSFGPGAESAPVSVTPLSVPDAPTIGTATAGNTIASIAFTPPANNGGSAITGFTATCNPGALSASGGNSPISVPGLSNGTTYSCSVTATNALGTSAASGTVSVVAATVPGAPTIGATIPGDGQGSVSFTAPTSNGGSAIISYTAICGANSVTGLASPITVTGLVNNTSYVCSVVATNAVGPGAASATASVTPSASAPLTLIAVLARKTHGVAGTFDLPIDTVPPISGAVSVEPRIIGGGHSIVFQFNLPITATGAVTATPIGAVSAVASGYNVVVTLTNVADNQRATISLVNVNAAGVNAAASIGFLVGDVNNTRSVNSSDISGVKARSGQTTTGSNFQFDVNASGAINSSDISAVKARSGLALP